jgi:hypothetical protein
VPSKFLNDLQDQVLTLDQGKHNRDLDEVHTGAFRFLGKTVVDTRPVDDTDVVRLIDLGGLGDSRANVAYYTTPMAALQNMSKVIFTRQGCSGVTVNSLHNGNQGQIIGFQAASDGYFIVNLSALCSGQVSAQGSPTITLHRLAGGVTGPHTILDSKDYGLLNQSAFGHTMIWAGTLSQGDVLYVSVSVPAVSSAIQVGFEFLIQRGTSSLPSSAATENLWQQTGTPDFVLTLNPASALFTVPSSGSQNLNVQLNIQAVNSFAGMVNLSFTGTPYGVTASLAQNPTSVQTTLTLAVSSAAATGISSITVTGTSAGLTHSAVFTLNLQPASVLEWVSPGDVVIPELTSGFDFSLTSSGVTIPESVADALSWSVPTTTLAYGLGQSVNQLFLVTGGAAPYTFTHPAALSTYGLSFNDTTGILTGTTTLRTGSGATPTPVALSFSATDSSNPVQTVSQSVNLLVYDAITVGNPVGASVQPGGGLRCSVGSPVQASMTVSGGLPPYQADWASNPLIGGSDTLSAMGLTLSLNGNVISLTGTPTKVFTDGSNHSLVLGVKDSMGMSSNEFWPIQIVPAGIEIISQTVPATNLPLGSQTTLLARYIGGATLPAGTQVVWTLPDLATVSFADQAGVRSVTGTSQIQLLGNAVGTDTVTATVSGFDPATLSVTVFQSSYTIVASVLPGVAAGTISPSDSQTVQAGGSIQFSITPATGYAIQQVLVDNVSVGSVSTYLFTNVQANHTIQAQFVALTDTAPTIVAPRVVSVTPTTAQVVNMIVDPDGIQNIQYSLTPAAGGATVTQTMQQFTNLTPSTEYIAATSADTLNSVTKTYSTVSSAPNLVTHFTTPSVPQITQEPQDMIVQLPVSQNYALSMTATGAGPLTYQWFMNGQLVPGANSSQFTFSSITSDPTDQDVQELLYCYCEVTNPWGSVQTRRAVIKGFYIPVLNVATPVQAVDGSQVMLKVSVSQGTGPFQYKWFKEGAEVIGETTSSLQVTAALAQSLVNYSVTVSNQWGSTTANMQLNVVSATTQIQLDATYPKDCLVSVGGTAIFQIAPGQISQATSYNWFRNGVTIPGATTNEYQLVTTLDDDQAQFYCEVGDGTGFVQSRTATLSVSEGIQITQQPMSQSVIVGSPVVLTVKAVGSKPISYQWLKDNSLIVGATSSQYTEQDTYTAGQHRYFCQVSNATSAGGSSEALVTAVVSAPYIGTQPTSQAVAAGSQITLMIGAAGQNLTYQWYKDGAAVIGAIYSTYTIVQVQQGINDGSYFCRVTNAGGYLDSTAAVVSVI